MGKYDEIDSRILAVIQEHKNPLYDALVNEEADRIAESSGRDGFRVIDGRLQSLRKAGKIRYLTKAESRGPGGWRVCHNDNAQSILHS